MKQQLLILTVTLLLSGCLSQAAQDPAIYKREFVGGDPQRRSFEFSGISGEYQELVTVAASGKVVITASLCRGGLAGEILAPSGEIIASFALEGDMVWRDTLEGPLCPGTYILRFHVQQARGTIILDFKGLSER